MSQRYVTDKRNVHETLFYSARVIQGQEFTSKQYLFPAYLPLFPIVTTIQYWKYSSTAIYSELLSIGLFHRVINITYFPEVAILVPAQVVMVICCVIGYSKCSDWDKDVSFCRIPSVMDRYGEHNYELRKKR